MAENLEHSKADRGCVGWRFWLSWVLTTSACWALGGAGWAVGRALGRESESSLLIVGVVVAIPMVGVLQSELLRRVSGTEGWLLATVVGYGIPIAVGAAVSAEVPMFTYGVGYRTERIGRMALGWVGAIGGGVLGAAQWFVLRRRLAGGGYRGLPRWVLASSVGGTMCGLSLGHVYQTTGNFPRFFSGWHLFRAIEELALVGGVFGAIRGGTLVWLLRQRLP